MNLGEDGIASFIDNMSEPPDIIINNYGINHLSWIGSTSVDDRKILEVNVFYPYWVINCVRMKWPQAMCNVVNVASIAGRIPQRTTSLYCASKAALIHMTKVMARELAPVGWRVNAVAPGKMPETKMSQMTDRQVMEMRDWSEQEMNRYALSLIPAGRYTSGAEVAQVIYDLLFMPEYVNGVCLDITGGV